MIPGSRICYGVLDWKDKNCFDFQQIIDTARWISTLLEINKFFTSDGSKLRCGFLVAPSISPMPTRDVLSASPALSCKSH